jgi:hypothetical protein
MVRRPIQSLGFPNPRSATRLLEPARPISLMLLDLGKVRALALTGSCSCGGKTYLTGLEEELLRACPSTSSTHASLSGLIETRRDLGVGPARPRGIDGEFAKVAR